MMLTYCQCSAVSHQLLFSLLLLQLSFQFEMVSAFVNKKYKLVKSDNFDDYMKALGVGLVTRKMGNSMTPTIELKENNGEYVLHTYSTFKNTSVSFKLDQEIDEETIDGRKVKTVFSVDGNKLVQKQKGEKDTTIIREFTDKEVKAVMTVDDVVCTRVYSLVE